MKPTQNHLNFILSEEHQEKDSPNQQTLIVSGKVFTGMYLAAVRFLCCELLISFLQLAIERVPVSLAPLQQTLQFSHSLRETGHLTAEKITIYMNYIN